MAVEIYHSSTSRIPLGFFIGVRWEILGICLAWLIGFTPVFIIMSSRSLKVIGLSLGQFSMTFLIQLASSILMIASVSAFNHFLGGYISPIIQLILYSFLGGGIYLLCLLVLKRDLLTEVWQMVRVRN